EGGHFLVRRTGERQQGIVRRKNGLAVQGRRNDVCQTAFRVDLQEVWAELVAEPEAVGNGLDRFDVEVGTGQITRIRAFQDDREGGLLVRVRKEKVLDDVDLAVVPVELELVEEQHGVAGVQLRTETVIGERPEGAVRHGLDAREALNRLSVEGKL